MKKTLLLGTMLVGMASLFTACEDDRDSNPTLIQPQEFVLNTPAYINQTIVLENTASLPLTWSQPQYTADNAPVNVTYEIQVSNNGKFEVSTADVEADETGELVADYEVLPNTVSVCKFTFTGEELDKSLLRINQWDEESVPAGSKAFVRIVSFIKEGTDKLNSIASNVLEFNVIPYFMMLTEAEPIMWYLLGDNIGDGLWSTDNKDIGKSTVPFFLIPDYSYNKQTGAGEIQYLNYFTTDGFKINPSKLNDWDHGFMSSGSSNSAIYRDKKTDLGNIWVDPAGYYLITVNTADNTCKIEAKDIHPTVYEKICITGSFSNWTDVDMAAANKTGENHVWVYELTVSAGAVEQIKFKIPGESRDVNWGFGSYDGEVNVCGQGSQGGKNIGVPEGTWIIVMNDITGDFSIIKKQE